MPGKRLMVRWKRFSASRDSWEPPSSFVPRYTPVWLEYLRVNDISLDVKDVLVHLEKFDSHRMQTCVA